MTEHIVITLYQYLKRPIRKWSIHNSDGGSFSNSGEYKTLRQCFNALRNGAGKHLNLDTKVRFDFIEGFDADDNMIVRTYESTLGKELPK